MAPHITAYLRADAEFAWGGAVPAAPSFSGGFMQPVGMSTETVTVRRWLFLRDDGEAELAATASGSAAGGGPIAMFWGRVSRTNPGSPLLDWQLLFDVGDLPGGYGHFTDHWHIVATDPATGDRFHWLSVALAASSTDTSSTGLAIYKFNTAFELQPNFPVLVDSADIPDKSAEGKTTTGDHFICEAPNGVVVGLFNMELDEPDDPTLRLLFRDTSGQPDTSTNADGYVDLDADFGISNGSSATYRAGERSPFRLLTHDSLAAGIKSAIYRMNVDEFGVVQRNVTLREGYDSTTGIYSAWAMASEDYFPSGRAMAVRFHTDREEDQLNDGGTADEGMIVVELFGGGTSVDAQIITLSGNRPHVLCVDYRVYVAFDDDAFVAEDGSGGGECFLWWHDVDGANPPLFAEASSMIRP